MWTSGFGFTFCHQRRRVELKLRFLSFLNRLLFCGVKMTFHRVLSVVLVPTCWLFVSLTDQATNPAVGSTTVPRPAVTNSSGLNSTQSGGKSPGGVLDGSMIQRALYVLIGVTMIGVLYFLIRAVRLKRPSQKKKKYGLLSNYDDSVEMDGVESDEDDTLYEARSLRR
ncbi:protein FAM174C [Acanthopagrus schlegelii]